LQNKSFFLQQFSNKLLGELPWKTSNAIHRADLRNRPENYKGPEQKSEFSFVLQLQITLCYFSFACEVQRNTRGIAHQFFDEWLY
jgi:hypothetical protein